LNPYQAPKAELFWMSPQERLQARLSLSARRWAVGAALLGTLQVAFSFQRGLMFLVVHGAMAGLSLAVAAAIGAARSSTWVLAPWRHWLPRLLAAAAGVLAAGLLGIVGAAGVLAWVGHSEPFGPLGGLTTGALGRLFGAGAALSLAGCAAWALVWRWKLATRKRKAAASRLSFAFRARGSSGGR